MYMLNFDNAKYEMQWQESSRNSGSKESVVRPFFKMLAITREQDSEEIARSISWLKLTEHAISRDFPFLLSISWTSTKN